MWNIRTDKHNHVQYAIIIYDRVNNCVVLIVSEQNYI